MTTTRFCIIRHGETDWNVQRRIQGQVDVPLNAEGREQAVRAARGLAGHRFAAVYSSDLTRTLDTATALAATLGLTVRSEPGLRERHYGLLQGKTADEMARQIPELHVRYVMRDLDHDFGGGECLRRFARRIDGTLDRLARRHVGQSVLLVTHGGALDVIYRGLVGRSLLGARDFPVPNAALNWIEVRGADRRLVAWADTRHLHTALDEAA